MRNNNLNKENTSFKSINKRLILINVGLIVLFFVSQILVTSILGTKTQQIDIIRNKKENVRLLNEILTSEIDKSKSLASSTEVKDKYNLVEKNVTFLEGDSYDEVASR